MSSILKSLIATLCLVAVAQVHAGQRTCYEVQGTFRIAPDAACNILQQRARVSRFPDVTFLAELGVPDTCFVGTLEGTLGTTAVNGLAYSGLTLNELPAIGELQQLFTSASMVVLQDGDSNSLGRLFFRDTGVLNLLDSNINEELVVIGGGGRFRGAKGTVRVSGNQYLGAPLVGTLCTASDRF